MTNQELDWFQRFRRFRRRFGEEHRALEAFLPLFFLGGLFGLGYYYDFRLALGLLGAAFVGQSILHFGEAKGDRFNAVMAVLIVWALIGLFVLVAVASDSRPFDW